MQQEGHPCTKFKTHKEALAGQWELAIQETDKGRATMFSDRSKSEEGRVGRGWWTQNQEGQALWDAGAGTRRLRDATPVRLTGRAAVRIRTSGSVLEMQMSMNRTQLP